MPQLVLDLTAAQMGKLRRVLSNHWDVGPLNAGWQSDELEELNEVVKKAIASAADDAGSQPPLPSVYSR